MLCSPKSPSPERPVAADRHAPFRTRHAAKQAHAHGAHKHQHGITSFRAIICGRRDVRAKYRYLLLLTGAVMHGLFERGGGEIATVGDRNEFAERIVPADMRTRDRRSTRAG